MHASIGNGEYLREKNALIDFDAVFLALHQRAFGVHFFVRRRQTGDKFGCVIDEIVHAYEFGEVFREFAVNGLRVPLKEIFPRATAIPKDEFGC